MNDRASEATEAKRKMMCLPLPTHKLISRVAALRGQSLSEALYVVFREELRRHDEGDAWALAPAPFSIKPTYTDNGREVLLWHPATPMLVLTRKEASDLAEAIHSAVEGAIPTFKLRTATRGHNVRVTRGGSYVLLSVDGDNASMIPPTATDIAEALISASVHAGPIPEGGPF